MGLPDPTGVGIGAAPKTDARAGREIVFYGDGDRELRGSGGGGQQMGRARGRFNVARLGAAHRGAGRAPNPATAGHAPRQNGNRNGPPPRWLS